MQAGVVSSGKEMADVTRGIKYLFLFLNSEVTAEDRWYPVIGKSQQLNIEILQRIRMCCE